MHPSILIVNQTFMPIHVVDEPLQDLYAGENRGSTPPCVNTTIRCWGTPGH
jgi:hypothetical protein